MTDQEGSLVHNESEEIQTEEAESEVVGSKDDEKTNICPICKRGFDTLRGLRLHWSTGHSVEDFNTVMANIPQPMPQSTQPPTSSSSMSNKHPHTFADTSGWNKFQILMEDLRTPTEVYHYQFDIIENKAAGNCLFWSVLQFLRNRKYTNIPNNEQELRLMTVNYVLGSVDEENQSNFDRFKHAMLINLQREIPSFASDNSADKTLKGDYARYMSTSGKCGTTVELCAMAEIFNFGFYVIQRDDRKNYTCYDFGSLGKTSNQQSVPVVHLIFTGDVGNGHFRLLSPSEDLLTPVISPGKYKLVEDYTSSRLTTIAPVNFSGLNDNQVDEHAHGTSTLHPHAVDSSNDVDPEAFVKLLSRCKRHIKILKRIPRGARISAANKLTKCIEECLAKPKLEKKWESLLLFAYTSLQVPGKVKNVSLTTLVKRNIEKAELIFPILSKKQVPMSLSRRVEYKISEGDVKGAVRLLSSMDTLAPLNEETLEQLRRKHPPPSKQFRLPDPPDDSIIPLVVSEKDVYKTIGSFPNGSASGTDGILPQHLKDLTSPLTGEAGLRLVKAVTNLSNFMLAGKLPSKLCAIMYGASLCALNKIIGGIRPIAVGNTFRRLTARLSCASVRLDMSLKFAPRQVGFGTRGGCEAAAHATRTFIKKNRNRQKVVLKIDFRNAFNEMDRDTFLEHVKYNCPAIYPFLWQCYSASTILFYGEYTIQSQNGAQQGDPCGPLIFCLAIQPVVEALTSEFVVFYLDDGTIAGSYESVLKDFETIINGCREIGLQINPAKCELYFCSEMDMNVVDHFNEISPGIIVINELTLLGAPISDSAFEGIFNEKWNQLKLLFTRLIELDNYHIAFYILKNCFSVPKLVYLLRVTPTWNLKELLEEIDAGIKSTTETLINAKLNENEWIMSSLPIRCGGLGIRKIQDIAQPAFLSSVNGVFSLVSLMLQQPSLDIMEIANYQDGLDAWNALNSEIEQPIQPMFQKQWDIVNINRMVNELQFDSDEDKARVLAIQKPESGAWLHALPSRTIGTLLDNNVFRISVGLRLGIDICAEHTCICGSSVDRKGRHGLKCKNSVGRRPRHADLNNTIKRTLVTADVPAILEPVGLCRNDGKRVDGMTLIPWSKGRTLIWDATCTDTFAPSNLRFSTREAGRAAEDKARGKERKYTHLIDQNYQFVPFAVETMGPWCAEAMKFVNELSKIISLKTHEPRSKSFILQKLSLAIQKGNATAVMGTFSHLDNMEEIYYL